MRIIPDTPLTDISQDKFGRESIVELIVDSINKTVVTNHSCMVYGIYGKWGEGKTSLMRFIKNRFVSQGKDDGIIIAEFNPWLVNNEEALLREFFKTIMSDPIENIRKAFKKYGSLAIFASKTIVNAAAPGYGSTLAKGIKWAQKALEDSEDTLAELKKKASNAIRTSNRHLIVMIDDVDRLDKEELHAVLRLIRQIADFDNCIYVVAMDVEMVAKSIGNYHGKGTPQDGRKFIDKIVQMPIMLPKIPKSNMEIIVKEELSETLNDYVVKEIVEEIAKSVTPFFDTYRELKRYCNQLAFVLPHLKEEVNISDLCHLEAIKMVSSGSYNRIYERRANLMREIDPTQYHLNKEKAEKDKNDKYLEAKNYITEGLSWEQKETVQSAIDDLFGRHSMDYQIELDTKRLNTDVYFAKYFTQIVPSDIIPDKEMDAAAKQLKDKKTEEITKQIDIWSEKYFASETKRALLYIIRRFSYGDGQCKAASEVARAVSLSRMAKDVPTHIYVGDTITAFVPNQIIYRYMFFRNEQSASMIVYDSDLLDDTFSFIFQKGELSFCLNMLCFSNDIFDSESYDGKKVLMLLIGRFAELDFDEQFKYSKFILTTLFHYWQEVDVKTFDDYSKNLFVNDDIPYITVFDKLIDGSEDRVDVISFVKLFNSQESNIIDRISKDSSASSHHSVKIYIANYKQIKQNYGL